MRWMFSVLAVVLTAVLVLSDHVVVADPAPPDAGTSPLAVLTGNDSHVKARAFHRITSPEDWKKTWLDHLGMKTDTIYRPAMEVDFSRCEVVVIFDGAAVNCCGYEVDSVTDERDAIVIRIDDIAYQTEGGVDDVVPFAFIIVPKSDKTVVLEHNDQDRIDKPPKWNKVARLPAGGD